MSSPDCASGKIIRQHGAHIVQVFQSLLLKHLHNPQVIPRLLEIMKTSDGDTLDPSTLWDQVKELCSGKDERTVVDRFLEVVTSRLKHQASQAKVT
jgi:hypothetical protein